MEQLCQSVAIRDPVPATTQARSEQSVDDAIALIRHAGTPCIAGITRVSAMAAVLTIPNRLVA